MAKIKASTEAWVVSRCNVPEFASTSHAVAIKYLRDNKKRLGGRLPFSIRRVKVGDDIYKALTEPKAEPEPALAEPDGKTVTLIGCPCGGWPEIHVDQKSGRGCMRCDTCKKKGPFAERAGSGIEQAFNAAVLWNEFVKPAEVDYIEVPPVALAPSSDPSAPCVEGFHPESPAQLWALYADLPRRIAEYTVGVAGAAGILRALFIVAKRGEFSLRVGKLSTRARMALEKYGFVVRTVGGGEFEVSFYPNENTNPND